PEELPHEVQVGRIQQCAGQHHELRLLAPERGAHVVQRRNHRRLQAELLETRVEPDGGFHVRERDENVAHARPSPATDGGASDWPSDAASEPSPPASPRTTMLACTRIGSSPANPSSTPPVLPGRFTTIVRPRTPDTPRDSAARGNRSTISTRSRSAIPGASRS